MSKSIELDFLPKIGITCGDINGIGLEVIIKTLANEKILDYFTPIIYGSSKVMSYHKNIVKESAIQFNHISEVNRAAQKKVNVLNCWEENVNINLGKLNEDGGKYAKLALERATQDLKNGVIDALVTAPINKAAMKMAGFNHLGHTEYFDSVCARYFIRFISDVLPQPIGPESKIPLLISIPY